MKGLVTNTKIIPYVKLISKSKPVFFKNHYINVVKNVANMLW